MASEETGCPYADDNVVYTVTLANGLRLTGTFFTSAADGEHWTMHVASEDTPRALGENAADWIAINPSYVVSVVAASGKAYSRYQERFGDSE